VPAIPAGSGLHVLGLVGTTVVPYNLFLGSGIAGGQSLPELRFGIAVAVGLGGIISMGIVVAGTAVIGEFGYEEIARVLSARLGPWAALLFASGLGAAGLSSAITAPLAAAVTARGLFQRDGDPRWREGSWRYRGVWAGVLLFGLAFGLSGVRPIPAIIAAQAFNGILLPMVAVFLLLAVNDRRLMGERGLNGAVSNAALGATVAVTLVLGASGLARAAAAALGLPPPPEGALLAGAAALALLLAVPLAGGVRRGRRA
jgi:Mn2+/Fe2+ NRAMP family transporter